MADKVNRTEDDKLAQAPLELILGGRKHTVKWELSLI